MRSSSSWAAHREQPNARTPNAERQLEVPLHQSHLVLDLLEVHAHPGILLLAPAGLAHRGGWSHGGRRQRQRRRRRRCCRGLPRRLARASQARLLSLCTMAGQVAAQERGAERGAAARRGRVAGRVAVACTRNFVIRHNACMGRRGERACRRLAHLFHVERAYKSPRFRLPRTHRSLPRTSNCAPEAAESAARRT